MTCSLPWWRGFCTTALLALVGCGTMPSQSSVVVSQMQPPAASANAWLESATLSYLKAPPSKLPPQHFDGVRLASHTVDSKGESEAGRADGAVVQVLGLRYPHPNGRRDVARAELIVADANAPLRPSDTWRDRVGRAINSATPGIEWGSGITQAKGLDVPIDDLKPLLDSVKAPTAASAPTPSTLCSSQAEINGQRYALNSASTAQLEALAKRVSREGRMISYPDSAAKLLGVPEQLTSSITRSE